MTLTTLVAALQPVAVAGDLDRVVRRVVHDSRKAGPDAVFVAIRGAQVDGRRFASTVDAAAIIADGPVQARPGVPVIQVADARVALAIAASILAGSPSQSLPVVGITGTNGKTTVTWLFEAICVAAGLQIGVVGTTGNRIAGRLQSSAFTTPEAPVLQRLLAEMLTQGCAACAMEVSSIGLAQHRVDRTRFTTAVFTSFSQDHLDFHGTMSSYLDAKLRLFRELLAPDGTAVVHGVDPVAERVVAAAGSRRIWRYGRGSQFDIRATQVELRLDGARARVQTPAGQGTLRIRLPGAHNVDNALAAIAAALSLGVALPVALDGLAALSGVPGRLEQVPDPLGTRIVLVDYAHTPDALARTLDSLRSLGPSTLLLVFGCGGDRDRGKRAQMGWAAAQGADRVWITNDNPRGEDPFAIIAEILDGLPADRSRVEVLPDRAAAIRAAVAALVPGDVLLIAGKGHETTQTIGDRVLPFDDRRVAAAAMADKPAGEAT